MSDHTSIIYLVMFVHVTAITLPIGHSKALTNCLCVHVEGTKPMRPNIANLSCRILPDKLKGHSRLSKLQHIIQQ